MVTIYVKANTPMRFNVFLSNTKGQKNGIYFTNTDSLLATIFK